MKKDESRHIREFMENILSITFFSLIQKDGHTSQKDVESTCRFLKEGIDIGLKNGSINIETFKTMNEMVDRARYLLRKPNLKEEMKENGISNYRKFADFYGSQIMGIVDKSNIIDLSQYDTQYYDIGEQIKVNMPQKAAENANAILDLSNMQEIAEVVEKAKRVKRVGKIRYINKRNSGRANEENTYKDKEGNEVKIKLLGYLEHETSLRMEHTINEYLITRELPDNQYITAEVYSDVISISKMGDPEYRDAVLSGLLSEKNILLSKRTGGYIGEIVKNPGGSKQKEPEDEFIRIRYNCYKINDEYALKYNIDSAVATLEKERQDQKNGIKPRLEPIIRKKEKQNGDDER